MLALTHTFPQERNEEIKKKSQQREFYLKNSQCMKASWSESERERESNKIK